MELKSKELARERVPWMISPFRQDLAKTERELQPQHVTMIVCAKRREKRRTRNRAVAAVATTNPPPHAPSARKTTTVNLIAKKRAAKPRKANQLLLLLLFRKKTLMNWNEKRGIERDYLRKRRGLRGLLVWVVVRGVEMRAMSLEDGKGGRRGGEVGL
jgi:hypothetical protein